MENRLIWDRIKYDNVAPCTLIGNENGFVSTQKCSTFAEQKSSVKINGN